MKTENRSKDIFISRSWCGVRGGAIVGGYVRASVTNDSCSLFLWNFFTFGVSKNVLYVEAGKTKKRLRGVLGHTGRLHGLIDSIAWCSRFTMSNLNCICLKFTWREELSWQLLKNKPLNSCKSWTVRQSRVRWSFYVKHFLVFFLDVFASGHSWHFCKFY